MLLSNTAGILEILYIFYFSKRKTLERYDKHVDGVIEKGKKVVTGK